MVKIEDILVDNIITNIPNSSHIEINEDVVRIYLYADGFRGMNGQVGHMELSNILIKDNRNYSSRLRAKVQDYLSSLEMSRVDKAQIGGIIGYFISYLDREK